MNFDKAKALFSKHFGKEVPFEKVGVVMEKVAEKIASGEIESPLFSRPFSKNARTGWQTMSDLISAFVVYFQIEVAGILYFGGDDYEKLRNTTFATAVGAGILWLANICGHVINSIKKKKEIVEEKSDTNFMPLYSLMSQGIAAGMLALLSKLGDRNNQMVGKLAAFFAATSAVLFVLSCVSRFEEAWNRNAQKVNEIVKSEI